jgi:hypothetical protein
VPGAIVKRSASRISTPFLIRRGTLNYSYAFKAPLWHPTIKIQVSHFQIWKTAVYKIELVEFAAF